MPGARKLAEWCEALTTQCCLPLQHPPVGSGSTGGTGGGLPDGNGYPPGWGQPTTCGSRVLPGTLTVTLAGSNGPGCTPGWGPRHYVSLGGAQSLLSGLLRPLLYDPSFVPACDTFLSYFVTSFFTADYWPNGSYTFKNLNVPVGLPFAGAVYMLDTMTEVPRGTVHVQSPDVTPPLDYTSPAPAWLYPIQYTNDYLLRGHVSGGFAFNGVGFPAPFTGGTLTGLPCSVTPSGGFDPLDAYDYGMFLDLFGGSFSVPSDIDAANFQDGAGWCGGGMPPPGNGSAIALCKTILDAAVRCANIHGADPANLQWNRMNSYGTRYRPARSAFLVVAGEGDTCSVQFSPGSTILKYDTSDTEYGFLNPTYTYNRTRYVDSPTAYAVGDCTGPVSWSVPNDGGSSYTVGSPRVCTLSL